MPELPNSSAPCVAYPARVKNLLWRIVHLLVLATLAISQPLLSILGENPTFFTAHSSSPDQIVAFAILVALAPAFVLSVVMLAAHAHSDRLGQHIFRGSMAVLTFLFVIQVVDVIGGFAWLVIAIAIAATYGLMTLYVKHDRVRSVVSVLAVLAPVVVVYFLFFSATNSVVFPDDVKAVTLETLLGTDLENYLDGTVDNPDQPDSAVSNEAEPPNTSADRDDPDNAAVSSGAAGQASLVERLNERFPPVYLLVFDELPWYSLLDETGRIDPVRYPNFARLAETSHVFNNATTVGSTTEVAVTALLASTLMGHSAPVYSMYPDNLFTLLGGVYDASSWDPLVDLCPDPVCNGSTPQELLDQIAADDTAPATTSTTTTAVPATPATTVAVSSTISSATITSPPTPTIASVPAPTHDEADSRDKGSLALLFEDAAIVFGHLLAPEGMDLGIPSIASGWGSFGGGLTETTVRTPTTAQEPIATTSSTTTTTQVPTTTTTQVPITTTTQVPTTTTTQPPALDANDGFRLGGEQCRRCLAFRTVVAAIHPKDLPRLHFMHTYLPHTPWKLRPDGSGYPVIGIPGYTSNWDDDGVKARFGQQRHLLQLGYTDRLLGEYLDRLEAIGDLDRAMVIVTADHGITFVAGEHSRGDTSNAADIAGVPLLFKEPHQTSGTVQSQPVQLVDIVPTIATHLGIDAPWDFAGRDMLRAQPAVDRAVRVGTSLVLVKVPEDLPTITEDQAADMHEVFGDGHSGSLYGLGDAHDLIGAPARDWATNQSAHCWVQSRPTTIPEADGSIGYVFGLIEAPPGASITFAIVVDGIVAATARSFEDGPAHRVFAIGDSQYWQGENPAVELHEIINSRLAPIPHC